MSENTESLESRLFQQIKTPDFRGFLYRVLLFGSCFQRRKKAGCNQ